MRAPSSAYFMLVLSSACQWQLIQQKMHVCLHGVANGFSVQAAQVASQHCLLSNFHSCYNSRIEGCEHRELQVERTCHDDHVVQGQGGDIDGELRGHVPLRCQ